ncbi:protein of unknown function [Microbacterium sp. Nx66]|nr:protein of unknown function [Microbacterium sp. Nx66]
MHVDPRISGEDQRQGRALRIIRTYPHRAHHIMKRGTQQIRCHLNTLIDLDVIRLSEVGDKGVSDNVQRCEPLGMRVDRVGVFRR